MALLSVRGVGLSVGARRLMHGVGFAVEGGQVLSLSGPSGSGKTELLRAVAGLRDADEGSFMLGDRDRESMSYPDWRRHVTYVAQRANLLRGSVADNLRRPLEYAAVGRRYDEDAIADELSALGLDRALLGQEARTLSVGEQQRVALVRALAIAPRVVLLDEPTSALDPDSVQQVEAWLGAHVKSGLGVVLVSHDPAQRERLASEGVDLRDFTVRGDDV